MMRYYILLIFLCFSLTMVGQEIQLSWTKDFNVATAMSKSENKPILVYFTKNDCKACSQFYTGFFKQDNFKILSDNFVLLMLDGSNNDINNTDLAVIKQRRLILHYNKSSSFPSILILNSDRLELVELFSATDETAISSYLDILGTLK